MLEVAVFTVLQHQIDLLSTSEVLVELDDEGRGQGFQIGDLVLDLLLDVFGYLVDIDALDRDLDPLLVLAVEDLPGGPFSQRLGLKDTIISDLLDNLLLHGIYLCPIYRRYIN